MQNSRSRSKNTLQAAIECAVFLLAIGGISKTSLAAAPSDFEQDIRCIAVSINMAQSPDTRVKGASQLGIIYYLGRVDGQHRDFDLEKAVVDELQKMTTEELKTETQRCGELIIDRGKAIESLGKALMEKLDQQHSTKNPVRKNK